jgi:hypothetical protein
MENEQIDELSDASLDDEFVLSAAMPDRVFGFHAQQAIEKLLKMLILGNRTMYAFTHDIERLQTRLAELGEGIPPLPFPIVDLSDYAAQFRYSRPHTLSSIERGQIRESVRILREHVHARLATLNA